MKTMKMLTIGAVGCLLGLALVGCQQAPQANNPETTGQYVNSSMVTTKVKTALLNTKGIDSTDISVTTYKGTVQLSGFVDTQAQKTLAAQVAGNVEGVSDVENDLIVRGQ
jgi:osmotically-inducible protein OsmY